MNRKILWMLVIAAASGAAYAQVPSPALSDDDFKYTMTTQAVQAEFVAFKKSGVNPWSGLYDPFKTFVSKASRAEVTAQYIAERARVSALMGEDSGAAWMAGPGYEATAATMAGIR
jgi:hypothetical protein